MLVTLALPTATALILSVLIISATLARSGRLADAFGTNESVCNPSPPPPHIYIIYMH